MMPNIKKEKGITFIVLVLTILLMLILVGASVSMLIGDGGVVEETQNVMDTAKIESLKEAVREKIKQAQIKAKIENKEIDAETINNIISEYDMLSYDEEYKYIYIEKEEGNIEIFINVNDIIEN